jgi:hypothetical protein
MERADPTTTVEASGEVPWSGAPAAAFAIVQRGLEHTLQTYAKPEIAGDEMHWEGSPDAVRRYRAHATVRGGTVRVRLQADVEMIVRHLQARARVVALVVAAAAGLGIWYVLSIDETALGIAVAGVLGLGGLSGAVRAFNAGRVDAILRRIEPEAEAERP